MVFKVLIKSTSIINSFVAGKNGLGERETKDRE